MALVTDVLPKILNVKEGVPLRLDNRPYLHDVYNGGHRRILLLGGRQIEKSTSLCATSIVDNLRIPAFKNLFISPLE